MNKYAVISTDNNPEYYNLVPLCCYAWKKLGFTPIVYIVNCNTKFIVDKTLVANIEKQEGVKDSTTAQLVRLFAYKNFADDDIVVTGDADMVQAKDIFSEHIGDKFVNFGFDLTGRSELPICYNLATAKVWRELMGEYTIPEKAYSDKWEDYWSVDQQLLTKRAEQYGFDRIKFVMRGNKNKHSLPTGRWDRYDWANIPNDIIDVHMKRNDPQAQLDVFHKLWPNDDDTWLRKFLGMEQKKIEDKFGFLENVCNWDNHRVCLLLALGLTKGRVIEFGAGTGSTNYLREYCNDANREFLSYDSNYDWAQKCMSFHVTDWNDKSLYQECGLAFIDHAPGEHRWEAIRNFKDKADIIVIHDSEPAATGYMLNKIWPLFKYRIDVKTEGAWASAVSNKIDFKEYDGLELGGYKLSL